MHRIIYIYIYIYIFNMDKMFDISTETFAKNICLYNKSRKKRQRISFMDKED